jgi:hypothetical protein
LYCFLKFSSCINLAVIHSIFSFLRVFGSLRTTCLCMILLRRYETKIVKKQPTLEAFEDFPQGKSTSNKLCTVLPTGFYQSLIQFNSFSLIFFKKSASIFPAEFVFPFSIFIRSFCNSPENWW